MKLQIDKDNNTNKHVSGTIKRGTKYVVVDLGGLLKIPLLLFNNTICSNIIFFWHLRFNIHMVNLYHQHQHL